MKATDIWHDALVHEIRDLTPTVREFMIRRADGAGVPDWEPGAHLPVQVLAASGVASRSYSLVGQGDGMAWRIAVKRLDDGRGGSLAMWRLAPGDRLRVAEPGNHFPLDFSARAFVLVAGGIGVTPLVRMAQTLAARGATVTMRYAARSEDELAYLAPLRECLGERLRTFVSARGERIDFADEIAALEPGAQMVLCGPVPMLEGARRAWSDAGRPLADLRFETFGASGRLPARSFQVSLPRQSLEITVPSDRSLLEALEAAGVDTLSDCRRGECGLCAMDVIALDGEIDHRDVFLSEHEKAGNTRLCACVSRVVGRVTLDSALRAGA